MSDAIVLAAVWVQRVLTGQAALVLATIAVAILGVTVMAGRLPIRRCIEVVVGIFLIFGASTIAGGLSHPDVQQPDASAPSPQVALVRVAPPAATAYDPYAGASVPQDRAAADIAVPR